MVVPAQFSAPEAEPLAQLRLICCAKGSLVWKRLNARSWPDCGVGATSGSLIPSDETELDVEPVAFPPASEGGAIEPVAPVVPVGDVVVVVDEALAFD